MNKTKGQKESTGAHNTSGFFTKKRIASGNRDLGASAAPRPQAHRENVDYGPPEIERGDMASRTSIEPKWGDSRSILFDPL